MGVPSVEIRGQGVAAYGCARLLDAAGVPVTLVEGERPQLPAILIGGATQSLLHDLFGDAWSPSGLPLIRRRIVSWGPDAAPVAVAHHAVVISEEALSARLRPDLPATGIDEPAWTVIAERKPQPEHHFGTRRAIAVPVELKETADPCACYIESLPEGWLFLIPHAAPAAWLLAVGGEDLLAQSRLIAPKVAVTGPASPALPAWPRIADPLCGPCWMSVGAAAVGFDPLCGDGTGHSLREAILASAVIRAGGDASGLLAHYQARIRAAFGRHLQLCRGFYHSGGNSAWWRRELDLLDAGLAWCGAEPEFHYRLIGFDLRPVAPESPSGARSGPTTPGE